MTDEQFFHESNYLESLFEFHRDWFECLSADDMMVLDQYYGVVSQPDNLVASRDANCRTFPLLRVRARVVFATVLAHNGAQGSMIFD